MQAVGRVLAENPIPPLGGLASDWEAQRNTLFSPSLFSPWTYDRLKSNASGMSIGSKDRTLAHAFGQAVRRLREKRGVSQEAFADLCGLDRTYVSLIERGIRNPTIKTLWAVAKALNKRPSELVRQAEDVLEKGAG
jgi:DNA-binding XRE family transcriptional regulator